jgi:hypothetical protein
MCLLPVWDGIAASPQEEKKKVVSEMNFSGFDCLSR